MPKGPHVDGLVSGQRRPRTSLVATRIEGRLEEPLLFEGTCDTEVFNTWLKIRLCPRLTVQHLVIMDNAAFHTSAKLIEVTGATLLFLPPYSPDFNPIEQDFAALKKRREYQDQTTLEEIVKAYNYRLSYRTGLDRIYPNIVGDWCAFHLDQAKAEDSSGRRT